MKKTVYIFLLLSPYFILFLFGRENIYSMVISLNLFWTLSPTILLIESLKKELSIITKNSFLNKKGNQRWIRIGNVIFRAVLLLFVLICLWKFTFPIYLDTFSFLSNGKIENGEYFVAKSTSPISIGGLLLNRIKFAHSPSDIYSYFFSPKNKLHEDHIYRVRIFPYSKIILTSELIE